MEEHLFEAEAEYEIWSPYDSHEAAKALLELLESESNVKLRSSSKLVAHSEGEAATVGQREERFRATE